MRFKNEVLSTNTSAADASAAKVLRQMRGSRDDLKSKRSALPVLSTIEGSANKVRQPHCEAKDSAFAQLESEKVSKWMVSFKVTRNKFRPKCFVL